MSITERRPLRRQLEADEEEDEEGRVPPNFFTGSSAKIRRVVKEK